MIKEKNHSRKSGFLRSLAFKPTRLLCLREPTVASPRANGKIIIT